jgi:hypothetical protein
MMMAVDNAKVNLFLALLAHTAFCSSELLEPESVLGTPMVELFPARVQAVLRGRK